ncbi:helix-hairpin-helix domain-containing protein [uncultured Draconibacterium sp.]|uniref:helix-hairpin-helix domain-containing protein n=1 Tax=uncultured Draconibacterium sp. TaxID=1573823 RepID=UPI0029C61DAB|nr:helix-hairpin-helix domain-containing protein [uncultured Draconibacterium sp.]
MRKAWLKIKNGFLSYTRGDRVGIIILSILILLLIGANAFVKRIAPKPYYTPEQFHEIQEQWDAAWQPNDKREVLSLFNFNPNIIDEGALDSLDIPEQIKRNIIKYRVAGGSFKSKNDLRKLYGMSDSVFQQIEPYIIGPETTAKKQTKITYEPETEQPLAFFDPNTAGKEELENFGFNSYQADNIVSYRNSGGSYRKPEDLLMIYGVDSATYKHIFPYLKIEVVIEPQKVSPEELYIVELNSADTSDLIQLKGIGSVYASRILKYRNLLGGFCNANQLLEVYGFSEELFAAVKPSITVDTTAIKPIRINYAEFSEMIRHPYFDKSSVNAILNEKDKNGPIKNLSELEKLESIDAEFIDKIRPYITCR